MRTELVKNAYCGLILDVSSIFRQCIASIPNIAAGHMESCMDDVCGSQADIEQAKEVSRFSLEAFALECLNAGYHLDWRSTAGRRKYTYVIPLRPHLASCNGCCSANKTFQRKPYFFSCVCVKYTIMSQFVQ